MKIGDERSKRVFSEFFRMFWNRQKPGEIHIRKHSGTWRIKHCFANHKKLSLVGALEKPKTFSDSLSQDVRRCSDQPIRVEFSSLKFDEEKLFIQQKGLRKF